MGKSLIQPPIKINFYYGRYLSSGCVMDGPAFTPWQDDGLWMPAAPCRGRSRTQQRWHQSNYCPPHHGSGGREVEERWGQRGVCVCVWMGGCFLYTPAPPLTPPSMLSCYAMRMLEAVRPIRMNRWMDVYWLSTMFELVSFQSKQHFLHHLAAIWPEDCVIAALFSQCSKLSIVCQLRTDLVKDEDVFLSQVSDQTGGTNLKSYFVIQAYIRFWSSLRKQNTNTAANHMADMV